MGFFENLRGVFDPNVKAGSLIETQVSVFQRFMRSYPERDKHAWLALTLKSRYPNWRDRRFYYTETAQFSLLSSDVAPAAFGIYLIYKEGGRETVRPYLEGFNMLMMPVWALVLSSVSDSSMSWFFRWATENPWTAAEHEWLRKALINAFLDSSEETLLVSLAFEKFPLNFKWEVKYQSESRAFSCSDPIEWTSHPEIGDDLSFTACCEE